MLARIVFFFVGCCVNLCAFSQECEWLSTGGGTGNDYAWGVTVDNGNNVVAVGTYTDSFTVGGVKFTNINAANQMGMVLKYDPYGNVIWGRQTTINTAIHSCELTDVATDANGDIYVVGHYKGSVSFGSGINFNSGSLTYRVVLVKYTSNGSPVWGRQVVPTSTGGSINPTVSIDKMGNPLVGFSYLGGNTGFTGTTQTISLAGFSDFGIVKYSPSGNFISAKGIGGNSSQNMRNVEADAAGNIYVFGDSWGTFTFGTQTFTDSGYVLLKMDSAYNPIKGRLVKNRSTSSPQQGMSVKDNGSLAVVGRFEGTVDFGGKTLTSTNGTSGLNSFVAYYDSSLTAQWVRKDDPPGNGIANPFAGVFITGNFIYFGGAISLDATKYGNSPLTYVPSGNNMLIVKMDTLGNFLWAFASGVSGGNTFTRSVCADKQGNGILVGGYTSMITIFNESVNSSKGLDYFAAKITDYTITRGNVSPGPYCAGDTFEVPYTKTGKYKVGNEFIAELSDSAGNFDGGERELGRITDTTDGVIKGKLPLFDVATTNKYRIRILSTNPVVQSFYRKDTLRLLIFSRDTANAGPDTTICRGQSIRLGTTGGSKWLWSPPTFMPFPKDTNNRQPMVKPDSTTEYRVIISDSSGCGVTDTDYVMVHIRPLVSAAIKGDSVVCKGYTQTLQAVGAGGNSSSYWYQWKVKGVLGVQATTDTFTVSPSKNTEYSVTIGDSCSFNIYTATFTIQVDTALFAIPGPGATICKGNSATISVSGNGCNPNFYKYEWFEKGTTTQVGNTASITVFPKTTTVYEVILSDTSTLLKDTAEIKITVDSAFSVTASPGVAICKGQSAVISATAFSCDTSDMQYVWDNGLDTGRYKTVFPTTTTTYTVTGTNKFNGLKDTSKVTVTVRPPLKITLNSDTTICIGETASLRATTSGGDGVNHLVVWKELGSQSTVNGQQTTVNPTKTTTYRAVLTDNCTVDGDSAEITVTVRPPLKVAVNADTTICQGESAQLRATLSGGNTPSHSLLWTVVGGPSTSNTPQTTVNPTATTTYRAVLTDNCTIPGDSAELTVTVRQPLNVNVNITGDTIICIGESIQLAAGAAGGYSPNHKLSWFEVGGPMNVDSPQATVSPAVTTIYRAVLSDNCTVPNDTAEVKVTVRPSLQVKASVSRDSICANQTVLLSAQVSGGLPSNHAVLWSANNAPFTSTQNPAADAPKTTTTYIVKLSDNCVPDVFDTVTVVVLPIPIADFNIDPKQGCPPLKVTLTDLSTGHDTTLNSWKVLATEAKGVTQYTHEFTQTGTYNVGLTVSNALGCMDNKWVTSAVTVFEKPTAQFIAKPDIKEIESPIYLYHQSSRANKYTWDFGGGNYLYQNNNNDTVYSFSDTGNVTIKLIAQNAKGCLDTQVQILKIYDKINCVIPNAFTPNDGDDLNASFAPVCTGAATYQMTIFNRWGEVILNCEDCAWNGTFATKPVPPGVYLYKIIITAESKKEATSFGTVNVVR